MPVKSTELRIGNTLGDIGSQPYNVTAIDIFMLSESEKRGKINLRFNPIPLTNEWLIYFGFNRIDLTENGSGRSPFWRKKDQFIVEEYHGESTFRIPLKCDFTWNESNRIIPLYHVHQLQNLYTIITGHDL